MVTFGHALYVQSRQPARDGARDSSGKNCRGPTGATAPPSNLVAFWGQLRTACRKIAAPHEARSPPCRRVRRTVKEAGWFIAGRRPAAVRRRSATREEEKSGLLFLK
jgi:hypothetical protein